MGETNKREKKKDSFPTKWVSVFSFSTHSWVRKVLLCGFHHSKTKVQSLNVESIRFASSVDGKDCSNKVSKGHRWNPPLSSDTLASIQITHSCGKKLQNKYRTAPRKISTPDVEAPLLQLSIILTWNWTPRIWSLVTSYKAKKHYLMPWTTTQ